VLRVLSDIFEALDRGDWAALTLLDLSAAFDTVDHTTLIRRLQISYSFIDVVLGWFSSYLHHRSLYVRCSNSSSMTSIAYNRIHLFESYIDRAALVAGAAADIAATCKEKYVDLLLVTSLSQLR